MKLRVYVLQYKTKIETAMLYNNIVLGSTHSPHNKQPGPPGAIT
jgi:hypothetical protein